MTTEFDDSQHYALFKGPGPMRTGNSYEVRWSSITLAALRSAGLLDNMEDGLSPPSIDKLWLDKNFDPAVLKEWNPEGFNWEPVTSQTLFGRVPWRGPWQSSVTYRRADVVSYQGNIWIALQQSHDQIPSEGPYWDLFLPSLADEAVTTPKLAPRAVTPSKLADGILAFPSRSAAMAANIDVSLHSITLNGRASAGDGLGGLFIDTDNGSSDTFTSADGRTWYRVADVGEARLGASSRAALARKQRPGTLQVIVTSDSQPLTQQHVENFGEVRTHIIEHYPKHDALFFLGDLVDTGDNTNPSRTVDYTFDTWISDMASVTDRERLFTLPGNHDVDRNQDGSNPYDSATFNSYLRYFEREFYYVLWGNMLFIYMGHMSRNGQGTITDYMVDWCRNLVKSHQWCAYIQVNTHQPRQNTTNGSDVDYILEDSRFSWVGSSGHRVDAWFAGHTGKDLNNPSVIDHVTVDGCTYVGVDSNCPYSNIEGTERRHDLSYVEMEINDGAVEIIMRRNNVNASDEGSRISKEWTVPVSRPIETSTYPRHDGRTHMNHRYDVFMKRVEAYVPVERMPDGTPAAGPTVAARFAVEDRANDNVGISHGVAVDLEVPGAPSGFAEGVGANSPQLNHAYGFGARVAAERIGNGERNFGALLNLYASVPGSDDGDEYTTAQLRKILSLGTSASFGLDANGNEVFRWIDQGFLVGRTAVGGGSTGVGNAILKTGEIRSFMAGTGTNTHWRFYNNADGVPAQVGQVQSVNGVMRFFMNNSNVFIGAYAGSPEGNVSGGVGSVIVDTTGGKLYVKANGIGNTGWVVAGTQT